MEFLSVSVNTTEIASDLISLAMIELGSEGTTISGGNILASIDSSVWDYADDSLLCQKSGADIIVTGYFPLNFNILSLKESLCALKENSDFDFGSLEITTTKSSSSDYENEWKKYYKPIEIGEVMIVPAWIKYDGGLKKVLINPGSAFGTGSHETTSMCLRLMQEISLINKDIADIGCGSGILGISSIVLGAKSAIFIDNDPIALISCNENIMINKVGGSCVVFEGNLIEAGSKPKFDVILANITADPLIKLADMAYSQLKPNGSMILSGIIEPRLNEVMDAYNKFSLQKSISNGIWHALLYKKGN